MSRQKCGGSEIEVRQPQTHFAQGMVVTGMRGGVYYFIEVACRSWVRASAEVCNVSKISQQYLLPKQPPDLVEVFRFMKWIFRPLAIPELEFSCNTFNCLLIVFWFETMHALMTRRINFVSRSSILRRESLV